MASLAAHKSHNSSSESHDASTASRVRAYWEQLSAAERQQILFIDDPDLVKQLYKLNLSLLCVGLMQRHLKTPLRTAAAASSTAKGAAPAAPSASAITSSSACTSDAGGTKPPLPAATTTAAEPVPSVAPAAAAEKTYELLEAMEFMDIGTGAS